MTVDPSALRQGLEQVFANPPATAGECAQGWARAVQAYASGIAPPSSTVASAASGLVAALQTAFATPIAAPGLELAFKTFAASVGLGMAGFAPMPPAGPVGFALQFAKPLPPTHGAAAADLAALIDSWMRTGVATLIAPPNTAIPWS